MIASNQLFPPFEGEAVFGEALLQGSNLLKNSPTPLLDARVLLKFAAGIDDAALIAQSTNRLPEQIRETYFALIERRMRGEPVAYLTGHKEFWSLPFAVTPDVLIPRNDSECLIEAAIALRERDRPWSVLDLGTGSGCLLCALLSAFPKSSGVGVDHSERAVEIARINAAKLGFDGRARFVVGDWLAPLYGRFDIIIANPPYIAERERRDLPVDILNYEPLAALFAGPEGMDAYRSILASLSDRAGPDGLVLLECGYKQASGLAEMICDKFSTAGIFIINDIEGRKRGIAADLRRAKKRIEILGEEAIIRAETRPRSCFIE